MSKLRKFAIIVSVGLMTALPVQAQFFRGPIVPCGVGGGEECRLCHLWQLASNIIRLIAWNIALPVAPLLIVIAGILYILSEGKPARLEKAKTIFINTLVGIVIIFCAWLIVDTILHTVAGGNFERIIPAWNVFPPC